MVDFKTQIASAVIDRSMNDVIWTLWASKAVAILVLVALIYFGARMVRRDYSADGLVESLRDQLKLEHQRAAQREKIIERLSDERNEAVSEMGKFSATVKFQSKRIEQLESEVAELKVLLIGMTEAMDLIVDHLKLRGLTPQMLIGESA
ncbi:DUF3450 domain-containing protein [Deefgea piscis]|uniref:DUF3450 domain-containing protein n=1 Tax=Deefgea piscis TaxID=2739061 RepID=UPI001C8080B6|nr:DUF3450 domain-containing protein [Deefgea piscis]QZA80843.1 DUF3450 domain-containing protein [Deefgea piscis]